VFVDGWDRPLKVDPDIAASGAVRLRGIVGEGPWTFETGSHELFLLVGPADAPLPELGPEGPGAPWHVSVLPFEVF